MRCKFFYFLIFLITALVGKGQTFETFDRIAYVCYYDYFIQQDSTSRTSKTVQEMILQVGEHSSKFTSVSNYYRDSILFVAQDMEFNEATAQLILPQFVGMPQVILLNRYTIFKNYPERGKFLMNSHLAKDASYQITHSLDMNWVLMDGDTTLLGYHCHRASTTFAGRTYTAWYTPEIPINDGPYKFCGLPGLIIHIEDSRQEHQFVLTGFNRATSSNPIVRTVREYVPITAKNYVKAIRNQSLELYHRIQNDDKYLSLSPE